MENAGPSSSSNRSNRAVAGHESADDDSDDHAAMHPLRRINAAHFLRPPPFPERESPNDAAHSSNDNENNRSDNDHGSRRGDAATTQSDLEHDEVAAAAAFAVAINACLVPTTSLPHGSRTGEAEAFASCGTGAPTVLVVRRRRRRRRLQHAQQDRPDQLEQLPPPQQQPQPPPQHRQQHRDVAADAAAQEQRRLSTSQRRSSYDEASRRGSASPPDILAGERDPHDERVIGEAATGSTLDGMVELVQEDRNGHATRHIFFSTRPSADDIENNRDLFIEALRRQPPPCHGQRIHRHRDSAPQPATVDDYRASEEDLQVLQAFVATLNPARLAEFYAEVTRLQQLEAQAAEANNEAPAVRERGPEAAVARPARAGAGRDDHRQGAPPAPDGAPADAAAANNININNNNNQPHGARIATSEERRVRQLFLNRPRLRLTQRPLVASNIVVYRSSWEQPLCHPPLCLPCWRNVYYDVPLRTVLRTSWEAEALNPLSPSVAYSTAVEGDVEMAALPPASPAAPPQAVSVSAQQPQQQPQRRSMRAASTESGAFGLLGAPVYHVPYATAQAVLARDENTSAENVHIGFDNNAGAAQAVVPGRNSCQWPSSSVRTSFLDAPLFGQRSSSSSSNNGKTSSCLPSSFKQYYRHLLYRCFCVRCAVASQAVALQSDTHMRGAKPFQFPCCGCLRVESRPYSSLLRWICLLDTLTLGVPCGCCCYHGLGTALFGCHLRFLLRARYRIFEWTALDFLYMCCFPGLAVDQQGAELLLNGVPESPVGLNFML